ncbi:MAG: hypothetical protein JW876_05695 [Candidatus Krumholzibacteriota bacterium]|nr:hypothetical protein [Candidatus Krumholzibacteriota bacterium]
MCTETTVFMQKAIYFVSRIIAARGIIELTDRFLRFQVSPLDASFGMKDITVDLCSISDLVIEGGDLKTKVIVCTPDRRHEFVLAGGQDLYDHLRASQKDPLGATTGTPARDTTRACDCGRRIDTLYAYCPWCGRRV